MKKYETGVSLLKNTKKEVGEMQEILKEKQPILENHKLKSLQLAKEIEFDSIEANKIKEIAE